MWPFSKKKSKPVPTNPQETAKLTNSISIPATLLTPWFNTGEKQGLNSAFSYLNDAYILPIHTTVDQLDTRVDVLETGSVNVKSYGALGNGVANDTAAFASALATGKRVYVPSGTYLINGITVGNKLYGDGPTSILKPFTNGTSPLVLAGALNSEVCNLKIDASAVGNTEAQVVKATGTGIYVHDLIIVGGGTAFSGYACKDSVLRRCVISGYKYHGATFDGAGTERCEILDCIVDGTGSTVGNNLQITDAKHCRIDGNMVSNAYIFGCFIATATDCMMSNNISKNSRLEAFQMATASRCSIDGNIATWDTGVGQDFGISLWGPDTTPCDYNSIINNRVYNCCKAGISLEASVVGSHNAYTKISGNYIYNPNQNGDTNYGGISLYGAGVLHTQITNNYLRSTDGKMYYGIREASSTYSVISDNKIEAHAAAGARILRATTSTVANNGQSLSANGCQWAPTVASEAGTITTLGQVYGRFYEQERMVFICGSVNVVAIGTATGAIKVSLPFPETAGNPTHIQGYEVNTGALLRILPDGAGNLLMRKYDGTPININNSYFQFSGWYERA